MTFADPSDYDKIEPMDTLTLPAIRDEVAAKAEQVTLRNERSGETYAMLLPLSKRQQGMILAGGLLNYTRESAE